MIYKSKVVGLAYNKVKSKINDGDYLLLMEDMDNPFDNDAIEVKNLNGERVGFLANSDDTLSPNNVRNGNLPASAIKYLVDFTSKAYYAEVVKSCKNCIYVELNDYEWISK